MNLSKTNLEQITSTSIEVPSESIFNLPEKVLQFGTGVLLRGLPDYFIDKANKQGVFNGRVVIVKSTGGDSADFDNQDSLYTICVRGIENKVTVTQNIINASVSRVLSAKNNWQSILECAKNLEMNIIISNTTEVGIQYVEEQIENNVPTSFPAKVLAFMYERYKITNGALDAGFVILPTELVNENGTMLKSIVIKLAEYNNLPTKFITWINTANKFCNTLVDRIVPGKPSAEKLQELETELGYTDSLLTMSEVFSLWAIEGDEKVKEILSFSKVDSNVIITDNITLFKELKLRLLNGTHTFNCGTAFLSGFTITRDAVNDAVFSKFAKQIMHNEIAKAIPYEIDAKVKTDFANNVYERFQNPFINHQWQSITVQYTSKMGMRNVPLITNYYKLYNTVPICMATGFAAFLLYMKAAKNDNGKYYGKLNNEDYLITDDSAAYFYGIWQANDANTVVEKVMANTTLWGTDLTTLPQFADTVKQQLQTMIEIGVTNTINQLVNQNELVNEA